MDKVNRIILILILVLLAVFFAELSNVFLWNKIIYEYNILFGYAMRMVGYNMDNNINKEDIKILEKKYHIKDVWIIGSKGDIIREGKDKTVKDSLLMVDEMKEGIININGQKGYVYVGSKGYIIIFPKPDFYIYMDYIKNSQMMRTFIFIIGFTMVIILFIALIIPLKRMEKGMKSSALIIPTNDSIESVVSFYEKTLNELKSKENELEDRYRKEKQKVKEMEKRIIEEENLSAIGRFSSGITHELRNFLAAIKSNIYLLKQDPTDKDTIEEIEREIESMHIKVEEFLYFIKADKLKKESVSIIGIIKEIIEKYSIKTDWYYKEDVNICADRALFETCIDNIVSNSVSMGSEKIDIIIESTPVSFICKIRDYGVVISKEDAQKAFIPFFSGRGSSGLGLSIVYKICSLHNWGVEISPWERGTELTITGGIGGDSGC